MTIKPTIDTMKKATAQDVGAYFFQTKATTILNAPAISENAALLGRAMINTFDKDSVDEMELIDGFIDCNRGGKGGREESYLGFMDKTKNLTFFGVNKVAILEVMHHVVEHEYGGNCQQYIHKLAYSKGIVQTDVIDPQDDRLLCAFTDMIADSNDHKPADSDLQEQVTLAVLNDVVYQSIQSYDCIQEMVDFMADWDR